jgi:spore coat protein A
MKASSTVDRFCVPDKDTSFLITRREFIRKTGLVGATLVTLGARRVFQEVRARSALDPNSLARFVDPLPIPRIARASGYYPSPINSALKLPRYRIEMRRFETQLHRDLKPTLQWGYGGSTPGPTIEAQRGKGLIVEWINALPTKHFLPIDHNLHGAEPDNPEVRAVVHLHGGKTPPDSDGYPEDWIVPGQSAHYFYPNDQDGTMLWYHDHAAGINRLNIFAGLLGAFIVRDEVEKSLHLPSEQYEIPLIIYDRMFDLNSQLYYPVSANPASPWITEFFGDVMLVNGKIFPYLEVEPRKYRFRVLNGANARFFHLSMANQQSFHQIGTDGGLLPSPTEVNDILLAPAERADLVIDFAGHSGESISLKSDSFDLMQFRVARGKVKDTSTLPTKLRPVPKISESDSVKSRMLTLIDQRDLVGSTMVMLLNGTRWNMPVTEYPVINTVEIWNLINETDDAHPIHLHLVRFQILDRRRFNVFVYNTSKRLNFIGPPIPPEPSEAGWKDTVRANPGMVTRIIMRFEGYTGRYVWHCHLLEHEDNEMMRPYKVVASAQEASSLEASARAALASEGSDQARLAEWCIDGKWQIRGDSERASGSVERRAAIRPSQRR